MKTLKSRLAILAPLFAIALPLVLFQAVRTYTTPRPIAQPTATARPIARHLPQKAGPPKKGFDMLSFPYTASGAGTSAVNGEYAESGVDGSGNPYGYNGTYYVRWFNVGAGLWVVASNMTSEPAFLYEAEGPVDAFPLTGWTVNGADSPAPTFAGSTPPPAPMRSSNMMMLRFRQQRRGG